MARGWCTGGLGRAGGSVAGRVRLPAPVAQSGILNVSAFHVSFSERNGGAVPDSIVSSCHSTLPPSACQSDSCKRNQPAS